MTGGSWQKDKRNKQAIKGGYHSISGGYHSVLGAVVYNYRYLDSPLSQLAIYLRGMDNQYEVLQTLSSMVAEALQPTQYRCIPRELILRLPFDWAEIYTCLAALEKKGYVQIFQADGIRYSITQQGINKVCEMLDQPERDVIDSFK